MTTTGSYSKKPRAFSIYLSALKSLIPMMIAFGILLFMIIALPFIYEWVSGGIYYPYNGIEPYYENFHYYYNDAGIFMDESQNAAVYVIVGLMSLLLALFSNAYMHQKKNVDLYHSIPVTRTQLLTANFLASITAVMLPLLLNYAFTIFMQSFAFMGRALFHPPYHWYNFHSFFCAVLYALVVYLFITFIAVNVGTAFDTFAVSAALAFAVMLVHIVSGFVWSDLSYGASFDPGAYILLLSPFTFIFYRYELFYYGDSGLESTIVPMLLFMLCALAAAAVFYLLSVVCYKRRKSETAEQAQTGGVFQTIVKAVVCFGGAALFYLIFNDSELPGQIAATFFGAMLIGVIAELILSRGFRSILKNLKWLAGTGAFCCILVVVVSLDLTGYVKRVPTLESVKSVSVNYSGRFGSLSGSSGYYNSGDYQRGELTLPESVATVISAHQLAVDKWGASSGSRYYSYSDSFPYAGMRIVYKLKNGSTLERYYSSISSEAMELLVGLEDKDDFIAQNSPLFFLNGGKGANSNLVDAITISDSFESAEHTARISTRDTDRLLDAIRTDLLNETLRGITHPKNSAIGYVKLSLWLNEDYKRADDYYNQGRSDVLVVVTPEYTNTIAALKAFGLYDVMDVKANPDGAYIFNWRYSNYKQVHAISGYNIADYSSTIYDYWQTAGDRDGRYYGIIASSSDPAEVARIYSRASNQMVADRPPQSGSAINGAPGVYDDAVYYVLFTQNDTVLGTKLIHYGDLPPFMQEAVMDYIENGEYNVDGKYLSAAIPETAVIVK